MSAPGEVAVRCVQNQQGTSPWRPAQTGTKQYQAAALFVILASPVFHRHSIAPHDALCMSVASQASLPPVERKYMFQHQRLSSFAHVPANRCTMFGSRCSQQLPGSCLNAKVCWSLGLCCVEQVIGVCNMQATCCDKAHSPCQPANPPTANCHKPIYPPTDQATAAARPHSSS